MRQEEISRHQLCERLVSFGWLATSPKDLGEDFLVHIYHDGRATGVTFHVQEKSITKTLSNRENGFLSYSFEVKDILHWHEFAQPVVLIVWNITTRIGLWVVVKEAVEKLDGKRKDWRGNKKVSIQIPVSNGTDDEGLRKLQKKIGHYMFPIIAGDRSLEMTVFLDFTNNTHGQETLQNYERLVKFGEKAVLKGARMVEMSDWAKPWLGFYDNPQVTLILEPIIEAELLSVDFAIIRDYYEPIILPGIELRTTRLGTEVHQLSNDTQDCPLKFTMTFYPAEKRFQFNVVPNRTLGNAYEAKKALDFLAALYDGGTLRIIVKHPHIAEVDLPFPSKGEQILDLEGVSIINKLCVIQDKTNVFVQVPVEWSEKEASLITKFAQVTESGVLPGQAKDFTIAFDRETVQQIVAASAEQRIVSTETYQNGTFNIFGKTFSSGTVHRHYFYPVGEIRPELENFLNNPTSPPLFTKAFDVIEIVDVFPQWFTKEAHVLAHKIAKLLRTQGVFLFGDVTEEGLISVASSIKLAVQGVSSDNLHDFGETVAKKSQFAIELYSLEEMDSEEQKDILLNGVKLV